MSGTTHVSQVVYDGIVAAAKLDSALTDLIGTDQYPNELTGLHAGLRDALLMIPPTLGVVDAEAPGDWTIDPVTNRSNSSELFVSLSDEVGRLIRESAYALLRGGSGHVGRLIVARLAHKHGLVPAAGEIQCTGCTDPDCTGA